MRDSTRMISGVAGLVLGGLVSIVPTTASGASGSPRAVETIGDGRLQATFDVWGDSANRRVSAGLRLQRGAMAYRFHVVAVDPAGRRVLPPLGWEIAFRHGVAADAFRPIVSLSASVLELDLPRPLGVRLETADSIEIVATWADSTATGTTLVVTIDFDPMDRAASRLAVVPVGVREPIARTATIQQWELVATGNGRLLAIAGIPMDGLLSLALQDVETGETLWQGARVSSFGGPSSVARLGVALREGHRYRIVASFATPRSATERTIVAMVLPAR